MRIRNCSEKWVRFTFQPCEVPDALHTLPGLWNRELIIFLLQNIFKIFIGITIALISTYQRTRHWQQSIQPGVQAFYKQTFYKLSLIIVENMYIPCKHVGFVLISANKHLSQLTQGRHRMSFVSYSSWFHHTRLFWLIFLLTTGVRIYLHILTVLTPGNSPILPKKQIYKSSFSRKIHSFKLLRIFKCTSCYNVQRDTLPSQTHK